MTMKIKKPNTQGVKKNFQFKSKNKSRKEMKYGVKNLNDNSNVSKKKLGFVAQNQNSNKFNASKKNASKNLIKKEAVENKKVLLENSKKLKGNKLKFYESSDDDEQSDVSSAEGLSDMFDFEAEEGEESDFENQEETDSEDDGIGDEENDSDVSTELNTDADSDEEEDENEDEDNAEYESDEDEDNVEYESDADEDNVLNQSDEDESINKIQSPKIGKKNQDIKNVLNKKKNKLFKKENESRIALGKKKVSIDGEEKSNTEVNYGNEVNKKVKPEKQGLKKALKKTDTGKKSNEENTSGVVSGKRKAESEEGTPQKKSKISVTEGISSFVCCIRRIPKSFSPEDVKLQLNNISNNAILDVIFKKNRRNKDFVTGFIYLPDETSLKSLVSKEVNLNEETFTVESFQLNKKQNPVGFIPRLPTSISDDEVKETLEKHVGRGKLINIASKSFSKAENVRNLLITFVDASSFEKAIRIGFYTVQGHNMLLREAFESAIKVTIHRLVYKKVPKGTKDSVLKDAIETAVGGDSIVNVRFSENNGTVAFVTFRSEEDLKKALAENAVQINGSVLQVAVFKPHAPKKRGPNRNKKQQSGNVKEEVGSEAENISKRSPKKKFTKDGSSPAQKKFNKDNKFKNKKQSPESTKTNIKLPPANKFKSKQKFQQKQTSNNNAQEPKFSPNNKNKNKPKKNIQKINNKPKKVKT